MSENKVKKEEKEICENIEAEALPVIDWPACLQYYQNDTFQIYKMLSLFADEIMHRQRMIEKAYAEKNFKVLDFELEYLLGSVCYLKLPQLEQALQIFYKLSIENPSEEEDVLSDALMQLKIAVENFLKFWEEF